ncbi:hypothetical protein [Stenomitos frigidus]|uniref:hypothetical protein n=1 Tax=Stenomitos frigidus TaxID=1886765 RepID=UPI0015E79195|nr:hypothetical protein [Stenomitos frigidus]
MQIQTELALQAEIYRWVQQVLPESCPLAVYLVIKPVATGPLFARKLFTLD